MPHLSIHFTQYRPSAGDLQDCQKFLPSCYLCHVTLQQLPSRGGIYFFSSWIWVQQCEVFWPAGPDRSKSLKRSCVLGLAIPPTFCNSSLCEEASASHWDRDGCSSCTRSTNQPANQQVWEQGHCGPPRTVKSGQSRKPQNCVCCFTPVSLGVICYSVKSNW